MLIYYDSNWKNLILEELYLRVIKLHDHQLTSCLKFDARISLPLIPLLLMGNQ